MENIIGAMLLAVVLWLFGCDVSFPKAINELAGTHLTSSSYWFGFFIIGVILAIARR